MAVQDSMVNKLDYVELGLSCADICKALARGMSGRKLDELNQSVCDAINQLTTWVESAIRAPNHPLKTSNVALWQRYKGRSSNGAGEIPPLGFSMRKTIRRQSPLGN